MGTLEYQARSLSIQHHACMWRVSRIPTPCSVTCKAGCCNECSSVLRLGRQGGKRKDYEIMVHVSLFSSLLIAGFTLVFLRARNSTKQEDTSTMYEKVSWFGTNHRKGRACSHKKKHKYINITLAAPLRSVHILLQHSALQDHEATP